jgi:amidase/nitrilase
MGCNELDERPGSRTIYNTLLFIGKDGSILGKHRKLMPTYTERLYWGWGDGSDLNVFETEIGRLGGLICWEHHMTQVRAAMIELGEEIHVAVWPGTWTFKGPRLVEPDARAYGECDLQPAIREHAWEAGAYVVSVSGLQRPEDIPDDWANLREDNPHMNYSWAVGGSAIVHPLSYYIVEPAFNEEKILYAALDPLGIKVVKTVFDAIGHYSRPDVVRLEMRRHPWRTSHIIKDHVLPVIELPNRETQRIAEKFELSIEKVEGILEELSKTLQNIVVEEERGRRKGP